MESIMPLYSSFSEHNHSNVWTIHETTTTLIYFIWMNVEAYESELEASEAL